MKVQVFPPPPTHLPSEPDLESGSSPLRSLLFPWVTLERTQKQRPQAWSLDSNVVFPELPECLSLIDFQRPVPEKKKIIFPPFSTRQPASICSLSVYPAWTCNPNKEFPREEQRKEKKTLVAFPNPFFLGSSEIPPTLGWPPAAPRSSGCTIVLTPRASLTEGRA